MKLAGVVWWYVIGLEKTTLKPDTTKAKKQKNIEKSKPKLQNFLICMSILLYTIKHKT